MSILLQNAKAAFVQVTPGDGRYHLVISADLVGHSELQDRLIKHIANSISLREDVEIVSGANSVPGLRVHLSAREDEIAALLAAEDSHRVVEQTRLGRSYSDIAADQSFNDTVPGLAPSEVSEQRANLSATISRGAPVERVPELGENLGVDGGATQTSNSTASNPATEE